MIGSVHTACSTPYTRELIVPLVVISLWSLLLFSENKTNNVYNRKYWVGNCNRPMTIYDIFGITFFKIEHVYVVFEWNRCQHEFGSFLSIYKLY